MSKIDKPFLWRTKDGMHLSPSEMRTGHLFYTLRMMWNHSAPMPDRLEPYNRYKFSSYYTPKYVEQAVVCIYDELRKRNDIAEFMQRDIDHMKACMLKR